MISVDTKKKELVGRFTQAGRNGGRSASPSRCPPTTSPTWPTARPSPTASTTWPTTPAGYRSASTTTRRVFAVATIANGGNTSAGQIPERGTLLITADGGGSNGHRTRLWKSELARPADDRAEITVCHYPPGTTKWNKIEHRLFSRITVNWRGRPLTSHEIIVNSSPHHHPHRAHGPRGTRHRQLFRKASRFPTGRSRRWNRPGRSSRHAFHGDWNYTLRAKPGDTPKTETKLIPREL